MLNINAGHNEELLKSYRLLYEYVYFVDRVRYHLEQKEGRLAYAVDCAVSECIEAEKSESYLEGKMDGVAEERANLFRLMDLMEADGKAEQILLLRKDAEFLKQMYKQYGIDT